MAIRRLLVGAVLGVVASALLPAAASLAEPAYPPAVGGLTVSATSVVAGGSVHVNGTGFEPGSQATVTVRVAGIGIVSSFSVTVDSSGAVGATVHLSYAGQTTIVVTGVDPDGAVRVLSSVVEAASSSSGGKGSALPDTGASIGAPLVLGAALVAAGLGALLVTRRRRRRDVAAG